MSAPSEAPSPNSEETYEPDVKEMVEDVAQPEADISEVATSATQDVSQSSQDSQEYNWKKARERLENLEYENRKLRELVEETNKPKAPRLEDEIESIEKEIALLPRDELLTLEQADRLFYLRDKKSELKYKALEQRFAEKEKRSLDAMVQAKCPDFFQVATNENVTELKRDPLLLKAIQGMDDPFDQALFIYDQIKQRGLAGDVQQEKRKLEQNQSKPRSTNSLGGASPLHRAQDYTSWPSPELQKQLNQEMQEAIKGA